jgi:Fe-S-cluster containining protein
MQDSNPRPRLRKPEGYPDYPNCPFDLRSIPPLQYRACSRMGMARALPCITEGCSFCCRETTMPITASESARLSRRTGMKEDEFCFRDEENVRRLLNNDTTKACVFLATDSAEKTAPGICTVYEARPMGCTTYPIVLNEKDKAILDELCPHLDGFDEPEEEDAIRLLNLEERLGQE